MNRAILLISFTALAIQGVVGQESLTLSGSKPFTFTSIGSGTYDQTAIYNDTTNGFLIEVAKIANSNSSNPIDFKIGTRGGSHDFFTVKGASGNIGIDAAEPKARLHVGDSNQEFRIDYNGTDAHYGSLRWSGLQFGNNGTNRIVAGRNIAGGSLEFWVDNTNEGANYQASPDGQLSMLLGANGNVGIGTSSLAHKLSVNGSIRAKEVIVDSNWADFVFQDGYPLRPLEEVERHIQENRRLPGIPAAEEVQAHGLSVGETQTLMMQKIEELTLYIIEQDKRIAALERENRDLRTSLSSGD